MKSKLFFFLLLIQFYSFAQTGAKDIQSNLSGKWEWVYTNGVYRGGGFFETPATVHYTSHLIFKGDVLEQYKNDTLFSSSHYSLEEIYFLKDPVKVILRSSGINDQIIMKGDSISMGPFGGCGNIVSYKKVNLR